MKPNIELHIDELVLHGFKASDRHRIGEAFQLELSRLLVQQGVPSQMARGGEYPLLNGGSLQVGPNSDAESIGRQIAGTVYGSLQPTPKHKERG